VYLIQNVFDQHMFTCLFQLWRGVEQWKIPWLWCFHTARQNEIWGGVPGWQGVGLGWVLPWKLKSMISI